MRFLWQECHGFYVTNVRTFFAHFANSLGAPSFRREAVLGYPIQNLRDNHRSKNTRKGFELSREPDIRGRTTSIYHRDEWTSCRHDEYPAGLLRACWIHTTELQYSSMVLPLSSFCFPAVLPSCLHFISPSCPSFFLPACRLGKDREAHSQTHLQSK